MANYRGNLKGSTWNKWDLHVHTPASVVNSYRDGTSAQTWKKYIEALEDLPTEIKVLGINDYLYLDGYARLLEEKEKGRLQNIELLLPIVELRISSYSGHTDLRKINYHLIFSDELTVDQIDTFFLRKLGVEFTLADGQVFQGSVAHEAGLKELGKAIKESTPKDKRPNQSDLEVGFANAAFPYDTIRSSLKENVFADRLITAVGLAEWDQMRWDGGSAAVKKTIINESDLVFTCSPSLKKYQERVDQLLKQEVNLKLLDCSDAHYYSSSDQPNRLGNVYSWLKADLSFRGLRRVLQCFGERVEVCEIGDSPLKLQTISQSQGKYIRSIEIRKTSDSSLDEVWFDCSLPISSDLVAIIGNQGNGKSALTDIIGLCGNTKATDFSFLNKDKFCDKENKASLFIATLTWEDGTQNTRKLDERIDPHEIERVTYVPQGFFELVTNEVEVGEEGRFYGEIKKAIFSHIPKSDKLGYLDLDSLIQFHTDEAEATLSFLREEMSELNDQIVNLEYETSAEEVAKLKNAIKIKEEEIAALEKDKPKEIAEPKGSKEANKKIDRLRRKEEDVQGKIEAKEAELEKVTRQIAVLGRKKESIENRQSKFLSYLEDIQAELDAEDIGIVINDLITLTINTDPLLELSENLSKQASEIEKSLDESLKDSLPSELVSIIAERKEIETSLEAESKAYQNYQTKLAKWKKKVDELKGTRNKPESLKWLQHRLNLAAKNKPKELKKLVKERTEKSKRIFEVILGVSNSLSNLTAPVHAHILKDELLSRKFNISFDIRITPTGLFEDLFSIIKHGKCSFGNTEDSNQLLQEIIGNSEFESSDGIITFVEELLDHIQRNRRVEPPVEVDLGSLLRKGKSRQELYDLIFSLEYLAPEFSLSLNGKPLRRLSPGERGILLLVFYLVVDIGQDPLIIDQPEGNLNNQSIFDNLVPVFQNAKNRRQVIIVTHNPNLAVVCDAEQIIHASIDFSKKHTVTFESGALENPIFNRLSLDVLEGTPPAFTARKITYDDLPK